MPLTASRATRSPSRRRPRVARRGVARELVERHPLVRRLLLAVIPGDAREIRRLEVTGHSDLLLVVKQSTHGTGHRVIIDYHGPLHFFDYLESFFHLERFQNRGGYWTQQLKPRKVLSDAKANWMKPNPHRGSDFDDFLKSEGIYEEVMTSPKVKKAILDLGDSIQAGEREAFAAGWNAFLATHSGLLMAHGIKDFRLGFEEAWAKYWQSRKEK